MKFNQSEMLKQEFFYKKLAIQNQLEAQWKIPSDNEVHPGSIATSAVALAFTELEPMFQRLLAQLTKKQIKIPGNCSSCAFHNHHAGLPPDKIVCMLLPQHQIQNHDHFCWFFDLESQKPRTAWEKIKLWLLQKKEG